jgi:UDP-N-acetylmuramyl pentapeptide phosphotransferase/UDP-N-acetylglucosamine-1-phosphate transferase
MFYVILLPLFFAVMLFYFRIAGHYNIIDHPNERSSHSVITIRGGGILFIFAAVVALILNFQYFFLPAIGIFLIGIISFLDDVYNLPGSVRLLFQVAAVTCMLIYLQVFAPLPVLYIILLYIISIGILNAYNFMDGINGITGAYSLVVLIGLQYMNTRIKFINTDMIWLPMMACCVFLFFNFRKKAVCFAGDVGSMSMAFWITILLFRLINVTHNWSYILFLSVYGVDTIFTILYRLIIKQNIFRAHRLHLYQMMANECKVSHLKVSGIYALVQGLIVIFVIQNNSYSPLMLFLMVMIPLVLIYILVRRRCFIIKQNKL